MKIFQLLLYVAEMLSSLTDRERRPIRIEFLTLQGKPDTHVWGNKATHITFSLSFRHVDQANPPRLQSTATLHPHVALILDFIQKRVQGHSTRWSNQVLKLTNYHISRHSTFKSLTKCATHRDLNIFSLHKRGITSTTTPSSLYYCRM